MAERAMAGRGVGAEAGWPRPTLGAPARGWGRVALATAVAALVVLVGYPLAQLVATALGEGLSAALAGLSSPRSAGAIVNTLWTSAVATIVALTIATGCALVTERSAVAGRGILRLAVLVPLLVPPYVSALSWARAYGPAGLTDRLVGIAVPGVFGAAGVVAVIAVNAVPLAYLVLATSLATRVEPDLERAARGSGASAWSAFRTVTLPLLRPAMVAAGALVFVTSATSFGVPAVLGRPAGFATVTTRIYEDLVLSADLAAFSRVLTLASLLVVLAVVVVAVADAGVGLQLRATRTGLPAGATSAGSGRRWPAVVLVVYLAATVVVPVMALVLVAVTRAVGLPPVPANWTLANFGTALDPAARAAVGNSLRLALTAAVVVTALGGLLATIRRRGAGRLIGSASLLTLAVPGSALAVAVLLAYGGWLRDTLLLILVAYVAKLWAIGHRTVAGAIDRVPPDLLRAARSSGAGPATTAATVLVPMLRPALAASALLVFLFAFHELAMSVLLYGPGTQTLAVVVLNLHQLGDVRATSALAVLLLLAGLVVVGPLLLIGRRRRRLEPRP